MLCKLTILTIFVTVQLQAATIAIIDTGFDLDHEFLQPKVLKHETDEEGHHPDLIKEFHGWDFHDNSHLKEAVIKDPNTLQEILQFRNLRAKGHSQGLTFEEFEWFKRKTNDKSFMEKAKSFKKHAHGTFVAGIALREGENINIFPVRGLNIPSPVLMVEDHSPQGINTLTAKIPEEKFRESVKSSFKRVTQKFAKICRYLSINKVNVVNASYGITYKNIITKFRENYKELTGKEISEIKLKAVIDEYFDDLYRHTSSTIRKYPHMLFVFSAGNSSLDNDQFHHYPSRIKLPNTITVAAMNGDFLASFSNFGAHNVDIGAPGVAIPSIVPKVYADNAGETHSPSSGTSMATPYISNLGAQIMNINTQLLPYEVKAIILGTGDEKVNLKARLSSGSVVNNQKAIKAAQLSKELTVEQSINLAKLDLIPMEDSIQFGMRPAKSAESLKDKVLESIPSPIMPHEVDDAPEVEAVPTSGVSSSPKDPVKGPQDNSTSPASPAPELQLKPADQSPSSQSEGQSPTPSVEMPASSSPLQPSLPEAQP